MKLRRIWLTALLLCILAVFAHGEAAYDGYIVCVREKPAHAGALLMAAEPEETYYTVDTLEQAEQMRETSDVLYIEPNYIAELFAAPNDPYYTGGQQWQLGAINWLPVYEAGFTGKGVTVAVIDSGLAPNLPDMDYSKVSAKSKNFCGNGSHPEAYLRDNIGGNFVRHGTFVVSQIAPITNNGKELAGTASGVNLMILRCFSAHSTGSTADSSYDSGSGTELIISEAVRHAVDNGADIISMSLGFTSSSAYTLENAIKYALSKGVIVVAAVGNHGHEDNAIIYPAGYDGVIGVGSFNKDGTRSYFSEHNGTTDVMAPGGSVYGRKADYCTTGSGTSFACPTVAAVLALAKEAYPKLDSASALKFLQLTSEDMEEPGWDENTGWGRLDAEALVNVAKGGFMDDCGCTYLEAIVEHTDPTCVEDGKDVYRCPVCHEIRKTVLLKAPGHDTTACNDEVWVEADCYHEGYRLDRCERCGEMVETGRDPKLSHSWQDVSREPADGEWGYTAQECSLCHRIHILSVLPPVSLPEGSRLMAVGQNENGGAVGIGAVGTDPDAPLAALEENSAFRVPKLFCFDADWRPLCKALLLSASTD